MDQSAQWCALLEVTSDLRPSAYQERPRMIFTDVEIPTSSCNKDGKSMPQLPNEIGVTFHIRYDWYEARNKWATALGDEHDELASPCFGASRSASMDNDVALRCYAMVLISSCEY